MYAEAHVLHGNKDHWHICTHTHRWKCAHTECQMLIQHSIYRLPWSHTQIARDAHTHTRINTHTQTNQIFSGYWVAFVIGGHHHPCQASRHVLPTATEGQDSHDLIGHPPTHLLLQTHKMDRSVRQTVLVRGSKCDVTALLVYSMDVVT